MFSAIFILQNSRKHPLVWKFPLDLQNNELIEISKNVENEHLIGASLKLVVGICRNGPHTGTKFMSCKRWLLINRIEQSVSKRQLSHLKSAFNTLICMRVHGAERTYIWNANLNGGCFDYDDIRTKMIKTESSLIKSPDENNSCIFPPTPVFLANMRRCTW